MDILFDMETGDPDDLITLLLLIINPDVNLRGVTCWQGSITQIGLIQHILKKAKLKIPVGGLNEAEPSMLSPYYKNNIGEWKPQKAKYTPNKVLLNVLQKYPDVHILTGAPLTNLSNFVHHHDIEIKNVTTQGGYLGDLALNPLEKFLGKKEIRTYNLTQDTVAFNVVNSSKKIKKQTYVTKDLCHGFLYNKEIHNKIKFDNSPIHQILQSCLGHYALNNKSKALHDPLAMLLMIYPHVGVEQSINMQYRINEKGLSVFFSEAKDSDRFGIVDYDKNLAWQYFIKICENKLSKKITLK